MRIRIPYRLALSFDYDGIEKWLNEQSSKGMQLIRIGFWGCYFEEDKINKYVYKIELLKNPRKSAESQNYLDFLGETGIEIIPMKWIWNRWVWLKSKSTDKKLDIYSDIDSKIEHYTRIYKFLRLFPFIFVMYLLLLAIRFYDIYVYGNVDIMFFLNLAVLLIFGMSTYGSLRLRAKIRKLKEEKRLHE